MEPELLAGVGAEDIVGFGLLSEVSAALCQARNLVEVYRLSGGDVYSVEEAEAWLTETDWKVRDHHALRGPESFVEAEAMS